MIWLMASWATTWIASLVALPVSAQGNAAPAFPEECAGEFQVPIKAPALVEEYNGIELPLVCIPSPGPHHVFVVGDWGGIVYKENLPPVPADKRSKIFKGMHRKYAHGVDDRAQLLVAAQMRLRATVAPPDYILNVGDNFYWGGVEGHCGGPPVEGAWSKQWKNVFEDVYWGPGLNGKPWLGVFGNHDFGGYKFTSAWEKTVGYTWASGEGITGRWITPALYWAQKVQYADVSVDYVFADTNAAEAWEPEHNPSHNICGLEHSGAQATCGKQGPKSVSDCPGWFKRLWDSQMVWMVDKFARSSATYLVVVTHFPPKWFQGTWQCLADRYGIDLFVGGHEHNQQVYGPLDAGNIITGGSCVVISGGGGGITSEGVPSDDGEDDQYGFVDLALTREHIEITAISHGGVIRSVSRCGDRRPSPGPDCGNGLQVRLLPDLETSPLQPEHVV